MALWSKARRAPPKKGAGQRRQGAAASGDGGSADHVIPHCCRDASPVQLLHPESGVALHGRFGAVNNKIVQIELGQTPLTQCPPVGDWVCVPFLWRDRQMVFMSTVRGVTTSAGSSFVSVGQPSEIAGADTRGAFRIPVYDQADLQVRIPAGKGKTPPLAQDVSATGIRIKFSAASDPNWELGRVETIELSSPDTKVAVRARVVRRDGTAYGLYFFEFASADVPIPDDYARLLVQLERIWLRRRNEAEA